MGGRSLARKVRLLGSGTLGPAEASCGPRKDRRAPRPSLCAHSTPLRAPSWAPSLPGGRPTRDRRGRLRSRSCLLAVTQTQAKRGSTASGQCGGRKSHGGGGRKAGAAWSRALQPAEAEASGQCSLCPQSDSLMVPAKGRVWLRSLPAGSLSAAMSCLCPSCTSACSETSCLSFEL